MLFGSDLKRPFIAIVMQFSQRSGFNGLTGTSIIYALNSTP